MRQALCLFLLIIGLRAGAPARAEEDLAMLARRAQQASVGIVCRGPRGGYFGTGTIIRADGVILTSSTVLPPGASEIRVTLSDGRMVPASLLAVDTAKECALAQLEDGSMPFLPLRRDDDQRVGQIVLSLGNAYGVAGGEGRVSVGAGILSGRYVLSETRGEATYKGPVLETDAPLNPGSDGGALLDSSGAVIGVLSLNYSPLRFLGTAVPIQSLKEFIEAAAGAMPLAAGAARDALPPSVLDAWARRIVAIEVERTSDAVARRGTFLPQTPDIPRRRRSEVLARPEGCVSGVCIGRDGVILTSWYNVAGTIARIRARDAEGAWIECTLLAGGEVDDLALLRAGSGVWEPADIENRGPIAPGGAVFALGRSPDPASMTVTGGIVSASFRHDERFFQHDAAANFGNSGGALIDRAGRFLGLAAYVGHLWPEWSLNSGIGFGVRPERIAGALPALREGENLLAWSEIPFLGVRSLAGEDGRGELAVDILPRSAAEQAGIAKGDTIVSVAGTVVGSWREVTEAINKYRAGDKIAVVVLRNGERKLVPVTLAARPEGM